MSIYTGGRIIPKHCGDWQEDDEYEPLSVVLYTSDGDSYISRKTVPSGTEITNTEYWAKCSEYSSQLTAIADEVLRLSDVTDTLASQIAANVSANTDSDSDYAAEVVDGRVDNEGNTYDSLGDRLRQQDSRIEALETETSEKLDKIYGKNLFNYQDITSSSYLTSEGEETESDSFCISAYIPVSAGTSYCAYKTKHGDAYHCVYDSSKEFVKSFTDGVIKIPDNGAYVRLSVSTSALDAAQFEVGVSYTGYEAYTDYSPLTELEERVAALEELMNT